jgi:hypothetical protein
MTDAILIDLILDAHTAIHYSLCGHIFGVSHLLKPHLSQAISEHVGKGERGPRTVLVSHINR